MKRVYVVCNVWGATEVARRRRTSSRAQVTSHLVSRSVASEGFLRLVRDRKKLRKPNDVVLKYAIGPSAYVGRPLIYMVVCLDSDSLLPRAVDRGL